MSKRAFASAAAAGAGSATRGIGGYRRIRAAGGLHVPRAGVFAGLGRGTVATLAEAAELTLLVMSRGGMKGRPRTHCSSRAIRVIRAAATRAPAAHGPMSRSCRYGLVGATGSSLFGMEGTWNLPFQRLEWKGLGMQGLGT
jgi:hypothetical protein